MIGQAASEEMSFESVNDADADIDADTGLRTNTYPISSPRAFGSGELKIIILGLIVLFFCIKIAIKCLELFFVPNSPTILAHLSYVQDEQ